MERAGSEAEELERARALEQLAAHPIDLVEQLATPRGLRPQGRVLEVECDGTRDARERGERAVEAMRRVAEPRVVQVVERSAAAGELPRQRALEHRDQPRERVGAATRDPRDDLAIEQL